MRLPKFLAHVIPCLLVVEAAKLSIEIRLWRLIAPRSMWHYAPKERELVRASVVNGASGLKMMAVGQTAFGPMLLAAAILFWILAWRLAGSRR